MGDKKKQFVWTNERERQLSAMISQGMPSRAIAKELGTHKTTVQRRVAKLGLYENPEGVKPAVIVPHIQNYKRARRGFHVPEHLERQYYDLLKTGVSIAEACKQLNIKQQTN